MPRVFTAIEIPGDVGQELEIMRGGVPGARWIERESYHHTLRFFGTIDDATARDLVDALERIV